MDTILLDRTSWDLVLDANRDIALATNPYALAQDAASQCRLFKGELWYDAVPGIPYFDQILGQYPPIALVRSQLELAALRTPELVAAVATITGAEDRHLTGDLRVTDNAGIVSTSRF